MISLLAASEAFTKDFGLIVVFGGIGVLVNVILILIAIQIAGERRQNKQHLAERRTRRV